ncbi:hypothetical protein [Cohnella silvisoli]|uniref:Uncharacterized protein n=1 Tax=Cohnella silvisoli TaxID=2873699 RepID=A0ABV1KPL3_9BACL|nr:hypothetical protein [Cohnella silvisoli]MCD9022310.1 hypothetical protein [Cohnella silvisoli]
MMRLEVLNEVQEFTNNDQGLQEMLYYMEKRISAANLRISHLHVDGIDIYDPFLSSLTARIDTIRNIQVVSCTLEELITHTLTDGLDFIVQLQQLATEISVQFYAGSQTVDWDKFNNIVNRMELLANLLRSIGQLDVVLLKHGKHFPVLLERLNIILAAVGDGLSVQDMTLVGDLIQYEISSLLNEVHHAFASNLTGGEL